MRSKFLTRSVFAFCLVIILGLTGIILIQFWNNSPWQYLSPLSDASKNPEPQESDFVVYGFLPYWNLDEVEFSTIDNLTHLAIFGLNFQADGRIQTREEDYQEPGWRHLNGDQVAELIEYANQKQIKPILTLTSFDNQTITEITTSAEARNTLVDQVSQFVRQHNYAGVNLDFEYVGSAPDPVRQGYTQIAQDLKTKLSQTDPNFHLSVSVYADSARNTRLWDLADLSQVVDNVVIMAYDFHRPNSETTGPVAPIFGAGNRYPDDILTLLEYHFQLYSPTQVLLGIPLYGYEWPSQTNQAYSQTSARGYLASYQRVRELVEREQLVTYWDRDALSPYLIYQPELETDSDPQYHQIYYEDSRSIAYKLALARQAKLGGVAFWALGYDGNDQNLWTTINQQIK